MEDIWRGEVQDLLSQITQLQAENKKLLVSLSLKESPMTEEDLQKHEGRSSATAASLCHIKMVRLQSGHNQAIVGTLHYVRTIHKLQLYLVSKDSHSHN